MRSFVRLFLLLLLTQPLLAQTVTVQPAEPSPPPNGPVQGSAPASAPAPASDSTPLPAAPPPPKDLFRETLPQDIMTAGYYQLTDWLRSLGLDPAGNVADLRKKLFDYYKLDLASVPAAASQTITIDSADSVNYFTLEQVNEKYIRISGSVKVTLNDNEKNITHTVTADQILLNQETNLLTASGNVTYVLNKVDRKETFKGESLTFNLDDWRGIFFNGSSQKPRGSTATVDFRFAGDTIKRSSQDVVVMDNGAITSSKDPDPYYQIKAKKIWIFAEGEWGLQDAALYVGRVPVFYFPFFFQPGDDMFFNPVLGGLPTVTDRRGAFIQTTTYLFGKKTRDAPPLSFLQVTDTAQPSSEKTLRGLYLMKDPDRKSDPKAKAPPADWVFKVMADIYTNLGFFSGFDGSFTNLTPFQSLKFSGGIGFSRTIFNDTPWRILNENQPNVSYTDEWNSTYFLGTKLPFRFALKTDFTLNPLVVGFEYFSDPFYTTDFLDGRSENFSMLSVVGFGTKKQLGTTGKKSALSWKLGLGSLSVPVSLFSPYLTRASVTPLDFSLDWGLGSIASSDPLWIYNPSREYFQPVKATIPNLGMDLGGTLFSLGQPQAGAASTNRPPVDNRLKAPWAQPADEKPADNTNGAAAAIPPLKPVLPALPAPEPVAAAPSSASLNWSWSFSPKILNEYTFDDHWNKTGRWSLPSEVDWSLAKSLVNFRGTGGSGLDFSLPNQLLSLNEKLDFTVARQETYQISPFQTATDFTNDDKAKSNASVYNTLNGTLQPLGMVDFLKASSLTYTQKARLYETSWTRNTLTNQYQSRELFAEWTPAAIVTHESSASLVFNPFPGTSWFTLTGLAWSTLDPKPLESTLSASVNSVVGPWTNTLSGGNRYKNSSWSFDNSTWDSKLSWGDALALGNNVNWDGNNNRLNSDVLTATLGPLTSNLTWRYDFPYYFDTFSKVWKLETGKKLFFDRNINSLRINLPKFSFWRNRIEVSGNMNSTLTLDFQRTTESSLTFDLTANLKIKEFLDFSITHTANNRRIYRYWKPWLDDLGSIADGLYVNPFEDLLKSFDFANEKNRKDSAFKAGTFTIKATQYMKDWTLTTSFSGTPEVVGTTPANKRYQWSTNFSLQLAWLPIPEIKAKTDVDKLGNLTVKTD